jgi:predicted methyltransferase
MLHGMDMDMNIVTYMNTEMYMNNDTDIQRFGVWISDISRNFNAISNTMSKWERSVNYPEKRRKVLVKKIPRTDAIQLKE